MATATNAASAISTPPSRVLHASILVVDDQPSMLAFLSTTLVGMGYEPTPASGAEEAVAALRARRHELAIVDYHMPHANGAQTMALLKEVDPDIEVVIATGNASNESAIECLRNGAYDYIEKPFQLEEFRTLLRRALDHRQLQSISTLYELSKRLLVEVEDDSFDLLVAEQTALALNANTAVLLRFDSGTPPAVYGDGLGDVAVLQHAQSLALAVRASKLPVRSDTEGGRPSTLALPLLARRGTLGAVVAIRHTGAAAFGIAEERRGVLFATQLTMALENQRLYQELRSGIETETRLHESLREAQVRMRAILDLSQDAIFRLELDGHLQNLNHMATRMFGYDRAQIRNRPFDDLLPEASARDKIAAALSHAAEDGAEVSLDPFETKARRADGTDFAAEVSLAVTRVHGRSLAGAFIRDVSERKRLEVRLRHAQKLESVGALASGIAHEINTPTQFVGDNLHFLADAFTDVTRLLSARGQVIETARDGSADPASVEQADAIAKEIDLDYLLEEVPTCLEQTREGVQRIATIVRAMKDFAHPDSKEKSHADINKAIQSTVVVARNEWRYAADLDLQLGSLPAVPCHLGDLNQVFLNLIVNAAHAVGDVVQATGDRGTIKIRTRATATDVCIEIEDSGGGIPDAVRERVFDPFFTTKGVGKGTGQGLAIAHAIVVEKHGGSLRFDTVVGKGTTFYITLPLAAVPAAAPHEGEKAP